MRRVCFPLLVALAFAPRAAWPQGQPLGPEFRVNTYTWLNQQAPSVASDSSGSFVVVWSSYQEISFGYDIFGQRYASSGTPLGPEFRVNTYTYQDQGAPSVAADPSGAFIVVWSGTGIFGQRYASTGAPLGPEFRVDTYTTGNKGLPTVAADSSGNFAVVWQSNGQDGSFTGVFGQRFASTGTPLGPEFRVNTYTTSHQRAPSVASDASGNFVVVWSSNTQDGSGWGVFGQRYASSGVPLGPEFRVNTHTTSDQSYGALGEPASIASDASGNFVVVWSSFLQDDGYSYSIYGQRYAATGSPLGPEFRVNTYTPFEQLWPSVAADPAGDFVVAWSSFHDDQDGSFYGVFGQRFASTGTPLGPEFQVNTYTTFDQNQSSVAADGAGNFVVVGQSSFQDGDLMGVFGQRYGQIVPVELMRFTVQ